MSTKFYVFCLFFWLLCAAQIGCWAQNGGFQKQADGTYTVQTPNYAAVISAQGLLESLHIGSDDYLQAPMLYGDRNPAELRPIPWQIVQAEQKQADTLQVSLALPNTEKPVVTFLYRAAPDALHITLTRLADGFGGVGWRMSKAVIAAEPLARPGFGYKRLPGSGLVYALPTFRILSAVRDIRYYLQNGRRLDVYYILGDASFNRQSNGELRGDLWGRPLLRKNQPVEFVFAPVQAAGVARELGVRGNVLQPLKVRAGTTPAIPFQLAPVAADGLFLVGQPARFTLQFSSLRPLDGPHTLAYRITDFWNRDAGQGTAAVQPGDVKDGRFEFTVKPKGTGWFHLVVDMRPTGNTEALPDQDESDFGVGTPKPALINPPVPANSPAALTAMLGLRCVREAIVMAREFPTREKSPVGDPNYDWKRFDTLFDRMASDRAQWKVTSFCLLNLRPPWANPQDFEELIRQIVARYKDRNRYWEIENEPIGRYTPETYISQALTPAYKGAHAADPNAVVMGPSFVRVDPKWFTQFFKAGGGAFLDAVSTHTYTGHQRSWEEHGNVEHLRNLRALMQQYGCGDKALWQTESGWTWDDHSEMPLLHAAYIVRMYTLAASVGIPTERNDYFYTESHGFEPWYLFDRAPNRGGMAARIFGEQTAGKHFDREIPFGKFAHAIAYTDGKQDTILVWTDDFETQARFRVTDSTNFRVYDLMGNLLTLKPAQGDVVTLPLSGFPLTVSLPRGADFKPLDAFPSGKNWALAANGGVPDASSYTKSPNEAAALNDGTWHFDDGQSDQRIWVAAEKSKLPQWAQVTFDVPRRIDTVVAVTPSSNVALPGPRDYALQVQVNGTWKTVRERKGNTTEWVLYAHFPPVVVTAMRVVITDLNNGWWFDDKGKFSDMRARVYELEAYGD